MSEILFEGINRDREAHFESKDKIFFRQDYASRWIICKWHNGQKAICSTRILKKVFPYDLFNSKFYDLISVDGS